MNKSILTILFLLCSIVEVRAKAEEQEAVVIEVKKSVSLSKNDKVYKNYIINGGEDLGLGKGKIVDVLRRVPVHDPILNKAIGDLRIKVAELEIIHTENGISVARLFYQESPEDRPLLNYEAIMMGDRLDLSSIRVKTNLVIKGQDEQVAKR